MNVLILSTIWGIVMMFSGLVFKKGGYATYLAIAGALVLLLGSIGDVSNVVITHSTFGGMLSFDGFTELFLSVILVATLFYFLLSGREIEAVGNGGFDYYALIFFVITGITLSASYNNLLMLFLGIEILSIPLYILTGSDKKNLKSNEASLKYFLMGSFITGVMLLGITLIYGDTGSFNLGPAASPFGMMAASLPVLSKVGLLLLMFAMAFKVSAAPFHFWTPDVYDGAPTVFSSFMATIVKAGGFIAFLRLFGDGYANTQYSWGSAMLVLIVLTLLIGNLTAVFQQSAKRMMAYSSIAQAGFMLMAVYSHNTEATDGFLVYTASYCLATVGVFATLSKVKDHAYEGFNGLAKKEPLLALTTAICLLSLAGIPLTGGFLGKYYMLYALIKSGQGPYMLVFAVLCAAVSVYYYFRLIQAMYFKEGNPATAPVSTGLKVGMVGLTVLIILLGIMPYDLLINWKLFF
ncbi:NADH-quinone oxidoreductase subunit N [Dinghuibacter silviterrae]|uniref:NADH-quinone oxidoreductase subunit N n=1 Tax=Dinghuibacter silviterrae TaxID=1539049 RepID=A0A4R8DMR5_9BACT|nr:NADH-quinone oxidoreductase subunit N [Dinghuibacter silviterrae]TDW99283.1 NADH dehydrogenase subunit N [Dinghuibacter silviterrae]